MSRFKRLTDAEARTLTRGDLLDRIEVEQQYWFRRQRRTRTDEDDAAFREFTRIMYAYLSPDKLLEAMQDTIDYMNGRSAGGYWDRRPGEEDPPRLPPMDDNQRAGLDYARRVFGTPPADDA